MVFCKNQTVKNYDLWVDLFKSLPKLCMSASSPRPFWGSNKESASCKETKSDAELSSICTWAVTNHDQPIAQHVHNIQCFSSGAWLPSSNSNSTLCPLYKLFTWQLASCNFTTETLQRHDGTWRCHVEFQRQLCTSNKVMVLPVAMS